MTVKVDLEKVKEKLDQNIDFAVINGRIEITRSGVLKILNAMQENYIIETQKSVSLQGQNVIVKTTLTLTDKESKEMVARVESYGANDSETARRGDFHSLISTAETRSLKRAVEEIATDVINQLILDIFGGYVVEGYAQPQRQYGGGGYNRQYNNYGNRNWNNRNYQQQPQKQYTPQPQQTNQQQNQNLNFNPNDIPTPEI